MNKLLECLENRYGNYIFPFFWQHGEDDDALIREIDAIYRSGIYALCVESRTHEDFCHDGWWHTMDVIIDACKKRNMKVWLLDDKHFPSGYANHIIPEKYPERRMWGITERHIDVMGPMKDAAVMGEFKTSPEDVLLGVIACRRAEHGQMLTGEMIDLSQNLSDGMVYFDVPEGMWRVVFLYKTRSGFDSHHLDYADKLTPEGGDAFIEAVYEPHYAHYKEEFGKTFAGFFSDEPCFGNDGKNSPSIVNMGHLYTHYPYSDEVLSILKKRFGAETLSMLPAIWMDTEDRTMQRIRLAYMDTITELYSRNFTYKLGDWCRAHGVEYIGHIIEDAQQHTATKNGVGHFFRALDGQDMAGIDVVLCQIVPGMNRYIHRIPCSYDISDPDFFHYTLPKLGASHAHIQPEKKGRAMCEVFGAYGWAEGLKMMKWLADFMLVRGINRYVPHAFTPKPSDEDCPPHFYADGENPQYEKFRVLMEYMNRVSHILDGGVHISSAALLYHAEALWANGNEDGSHMRVDVPAKYLTEQHFDFDIVPLDYLHDVNVKNGCIRLSEEDFPALIVPAARSLPKDTVSVLLRLAGEGLPVILLKNSVGDPEPVISETGETVPFGAAGVITAELEEIGAILTTRGCADITLDHDEPFLRVYHYVNGGTHYCMLTNENINDTIHCDMRIKGFSGGGYAVYDAMENKAFSEISGDGTIPLTLEPYGSVIYAFGELPDALPRMEHDAEVSAQQVSCTWDILTAEQKDYPIYTPYRTTDTLFNINGKDALPHFGGHIQYETNLWVDSVFSDMRVILDLGFVGEAATLTVNGNLVGDRITPPYRFDITDYVKKGENSITVDVITHLGYRKRDAFSGFLLFEPTGLLGPVSLHYLRKI